MSKRKSLTFFFLIGLFFLSGCSSGLADEPAEFADKGVSFQMQLPQEWETSQNPEQEYNAEAVLGAEDTKSNSTLYLLTQKKTDVELDGLGERTREEIRERYNFETTDSVRMDSLEIEGFPAYKYTIGIIREKKKVLLYFYYIETKSSLVQAVIYSAVDGNEDKRGELLDQSLATLQETGEDAASIAKEDERLFIQNEELAFEITGLLRLKQEDKVLLAIRYTTEAFTSADLTPAYWQQVITAYQGETMLIPIASLSEANRLDLNELLENQNQPVAKDHLVESAIVYELTDESNVLLAAEPTVFPDQKEISLALPYGQSKEAE